MTAVPWPLLAVALAWALLYVYGPGWSAAVRRHRRMNGHH